MRDVGYEKRGPTYLFVTNNDSPLSLLQLRGREKGGEGGRRVLGWLVGWLGARENPCGTVGAQSCVSNVEVGRHVVSSVR